jgi:hypothetical protein
VIEDVRAIRYDRRQTRCGEERLDHVTLMLFADSVLMAIEGAGGQARTGRPAQQVRRDSQPPQRYVDGLQALCGRAGFTCASVLDKRVKLAGMNEFHAAAKQQDTRVVNF